MEYYSTIKRNKPLIHKKTWVNLQFILLSKINWYKKATYGGPSVSTGDWFQEPPSCIQNSGNAQDP